MKLRQSMRININEGRLKDIIHNTIENYVKKRLVSQNSRFLVNEGLITSYNIGKVVRILRRKFNFESMDAVISPFDNNRDANDDFYNYTVRDKNLMTTQDTDNWGRFEIYFNDGIGGNGEIVKDMIRVCDVCGWKYTHSLVYIHNGSEWKPYVIKDIDFNDKELTSRPIMLHFRAKFNENGENEVGYEDF